MPALPKPNDARQRRKEVAGQADRRLPVSGRQGPIPKPPVPLGVDGRRWWRWAWKTPQACMWHAGYTESVIKRAQLEDQFAGASKNENVTDLSRISALILRLDDALGLTPAGAAKLHLVFIEPEPDPVVTGDAKNVTPIRGRLKGMRE